MTLQELQEAVKTLVLTEEDKARITCSLKEWDEECLARQESMRPTSEMLNRLYTL